MAPLNKLSDPEVVELYKERVRKVKEGKIAPVFGYDTETFASLRSRFGKKDVAFMIRSGYPIGINVTENKKFSPSFSSSPRSLSPFSKAMMSNNENAPNENYKPLAHLGDSEIVDLFKKRVKLIKQGKIAPITDLDEYTFDDVKEMFGGMKDAVDTIRHTFPYGISLVETKRSPTYARDVKDLKNDSLVVEKFKKRVKLVQEGKITPSMRYDETTFDEMKEMFNGKKGAVEYIRIAYPHGISLTENKKSSPSPVKYSPSPKKDTKEGTKEERRRAYEKQLKNIANEAVRTTNIKNLKGMTNDNIIRVYGKTRGEALIAKRNQAGPEITKEGTKEERRRAYEKQLKNIANEAVRTTNIKNLKGMTNDNIIQVYGKTRGEALIAKRKKAGSDESSTKTIEVKGSLPKGKHVELFLENGKVSFKKMSDKSVRVKGTVIDSRDGKSTVSYTDPRKNDNFSLDMDEMDDENILIIMGETKGKEFIAQRNKAARAEGDKRAKEQARIDADQERRRKDRESQKESQEKQRKEHEEQQRKRDREWEDFEKRQQKDKTPLTPMKKMKIAGGREKFDFAEKITKCSRVLTLDQVEMPTCWFNALMMALFFSQNTRIAIANSLQFIKDPNKFPIVVDIGKLLEGYNKTRASKDLYKRLQPKEFLETLRQKQPSQFPPRNRDAKPGEYVYYKGDSLEYMHRMLQFLEIPHLLLSRPSFKSSKTEWSYYNYDVYESKIFGAGAQKEVGIRKDTSTLKSVDTKHPVILTICTEDDHDKMMTEKVSSRWASYTTYPVEGLLPDGHASVIKYNGTKYYLDSLLLGNYNAEACTKGHAIAGVTCNGDRFLYNGYTYKSVDPGMRKNFQGGKEACPLEPTEWAHTTNFCLSNTCGIDKFVSKMDTKEMCFSTLRNARLTYVREDYVGNRIPSIPTALDRMKQKQTEAGIFNDKRLKNMGILQRDPITRQYVVTKR